MEDLNEEIKQMNIRQKKWGRELTRDSGAGHIVVYIINIWIHSHISSTEAGSKM